MYFKKGKSSIQLKYIKIGKYFPRIIVRHIPVSALDSIEAEEPKRGKQAWSVSNSGTLLTRPNGAWLPMARITKRKEGYGIGGAGPR